MRPLECLTKPYIQLSSQPPGTAARSVFIDVLRVCIVDGDNFYDTEFVKGLNKENISHAQTLQSGSELAD